MFYLPSSSSLATDLQGSPLWVSDPDEVVGEADVLLELPEEVDTEAGAALAVHCRAAARVGSGHKRLVSRHHTSLSIIFCILKLTLPFALPTKLCCGNMMNELCIQFLNCFQQSVISLYQLSEVSVKQQQTKQIYPTILDRSMMIYFFPVW